MAQKKQRKDTYIGRWFSDLYGIFANEMKLIFTDIGIVTIFIVAGLIYPPLYTYIYSIGVVEEMPVAVVDLSNGPYSRRYIQKVDATRECRVAYDCMSLAEAERLMAEQKVHGVFYIPADFDATIVEGQHQAYVSTYADMSTYLNYKNMTLASNYVMLDEMHQIQLEHYARGMGVGGGTGSIDASDAIVGEDAWQYIEPIRWIDDIHYNPNISFTMFLIYAIMLLIIQQTMFYGSSMLAGTLREEHRSFATYTDDLSGIGMGRVVLGRGAAYFAVYIVMAAYITVLSPWLFHLPVHCAWWEMMVMMLFFVTDCIFFCFTWSTFITKRETVLVLLLCMTPITLFLTGFGWPSSNIPKFWKAFSYLFPSTFGVRAYINLNMSEGGLEAVKPEIFAMTVQMVIYYFLACAAVYVENFMLKNRHRLIAVRARIDERRGFDRAESIRMLTGEEE